AGVVVPLEPREAVAYARIDSTDTIAKAYKPSGFLARFVDMDDDEGGASASVGGRSRRQAFSTDFGPQVWYNRVEAAHLGAEATLGLGPSRLRGQLGYSTGLETLTYEAALSHTVRPSRRDWLRLAVGGRREVAPRISSAAYGR